MTLDISFSIHTYTMAAVLSQEETDHFVRVVNFKKLDFLVSSLSDPPTPGFFTTTPNLYSQQNDLPIIHKN